MFRRVRSIVRSRQEVFCQRLHHVGSRDTELDTDDLPLIDTPFVASVEDLLFVKRIKKTFFGVRRSGSGYEFYVMDQKYRAGG